MRMQEGTRVNPTVQVRRVQAADIPHVIALDTRVTRIAKTEYWKDIFSRYGRQRSRERFFLIAEGCVNRSAAADFLGFIIGEIRAWEFGSSPCGWVFALSVEPKVRLHGIGSALLARCLEFARTVGYERMMLWTHSVLLEARRLYAREGFRLIRTEPHTLFGLPLTGEFWELTLSPSARADPALD